MLLRLPMESAKIANAEPLASSRPLCRGFPMDTPVENADLPRFTRLSDADGTRTRGRFVNRVFVEVE